jgi:hypothetical protein
MNESQVLGGRAFSNSTALPGLPLHVQRGGYLLVRDGVVAEPHRGLKLVSASPRSSVFNAMYERYNQSTGSGLAL